MHLEHHYEVEYDFIRELQEIATAPRSWARLERKRGTRKRDSQQAWNTTQKWIFDPEENRFEMLREYCIRTAQRDASTGDLTHEEYEDFFMGWLADIAKRDTLAPKLEEGEKISKSVLYWWYRQYIQRASMKGAQDVLHRVYGARTQSEITHDKAPQHNLKNMEDNGFFEAKVVYKIDDSGSSVGDPDYYVEGNPVTSEVEIESLNEAIRKILVNSYGEEKAQDRYKLYRQMVEGRGGYENLEEWADSWGINVAKLKHQIAHIEKLIFLNKENLGY